MLINIYRALYDNIKKSQCAVFDLLALKDVIMDVSSRSPCCYDNLSRHEMKATYSPMTGQIFDATIVASSDEDWL